MSLLFKKPEVKTVDPIEKLQNESESAISIFKDTVDRLSSANLGVEAEEERENEVVRQAKARLSQLSEIKSQNEKFIGKINDLFS